MSEAMTGKTVVAVAHRLSTLAHLDRLLVIDQRTSLSRTARTPTCSRAMGIYA